MEQATIEVIKDLSGLVMLIAFMLFSIKWLAKKYDELLAAERDRNDKFMAMLSNFDKDAVTYRTQTANALKTISDGIVEIKQIIQARDSK